MRRGFTLLEVILVMAVLVLLAAISYPSLEALGADFRLNAAADLVRARWADARSRAIEDGLSYRFAVKLNTRRMRVAPDADEFWNGTDTNTSQAVSNGDDTFQQPPLQVEDDLPTGVKFTNSDGEDGEASNEWFTIATFLPDGTCSADVQIRFQTSGARPGVLKLRGMTGSARFEILPSTRNR